VRERSSLSQGALNSGMLVPDPIIHHAPCLTKERPSATQKVTIRKITRLK